MGRVSKSNKAKSVFRKNKDWQALFVKHNLPLGKNYLYCPRGPVFSLRQAQAIYSLSEVVRQLAGDRVEGFIKTIKELVKQENVMFLRIEPTFETSEDELKKLGFAKTKDVQPSKTLILDLSESEEKLLSQMHEKTRYNIGLAQRKGVIIKNSQFPIPNSQFEIFWNLMQQTAQRQKIKLHSKIYYQKQLQIPDGDLKMMLFVAEYKNQVIAANIVALFGKAATYLHGGSGNAFKNLMAPHLLQWEQIREAKRQGCVQYDFWGIDENRWPGITRFKKGFGGREVNYSGTWDLVFQPAWYRMYQLVKRTLS